MKESNVRQSNSNEIFALCLFTGLLGFFVTWQSDFDLSGIRGFLIGFFIPFALYIFMSLIFKEKHKTSRKAIQIDADEVTIKETNRGKNVEINITIPKSFLNQ